MVLRENVAYLVDDRRREAAFRALRQRVGLTPAAVYHAPGTVLLEIATLGGAFPTLRVSRLRQVALLTLDYFEGDLRKALALPFPKARRALTRYPAIGEPGAEKILLFTKTAPVLALESNGLRVLQRIGYARAKKGYAASYRAAQEATRSQWGKRCDRLIEGHLLLRLHGRELCKASGPLCERCPIRTHCAYAAGHASA
jgi:endonuclease-3